MSEAPEVLRFYDDELSKTLKFMTRGGNNKYVRADRIEELEAKHTELVSAVSDLLCDVRYSILDEQSADGEGYDLWKDVKKFRRVIHAAGLADMKGQDDE